MTPEYSFAIHCICNYFSDNAKSIKTHHEDLSKALKWNTKCYFDDELNAFLETCTEPWNVSTYFMLLTIAVQRHLYFLLSFLE